MTDRYWLRHPSLRGHQGPFDEAALRRAVEGGAFPPDSQALPDEGQDESARQTATGWIPVTRLLGLAEPAPAPTAPGAQRHEPGPQQLAETRRRRVREHTAYSLVRSLISVLAFLMIAFVVVGTLIGLGQGAGSGAPVALLITAALEVLGVLVVAGVLQALLDIADDAVRRHPDAQ